MRDKLERLERLLQYLIALTLFGCISCESGALDLTVLTSLEPATDVVGDDGAALVTSAGATVEFGTVTLVFPPDALHEDLRVSVVEGSPPSGTPIWHFISPVFDLQPSGVEFLKPVLLKIRTQFFLTDNERPLIAYVRDEMSPPEPLASSVHDGEVTALVTHFSGFVIIGDALCGASNDLLNSRVCGANELCCNNRCERVDRRERCNFCNRSCGSDEMCVGVEGGWTCEKPKSCIDGDCEPGTVCCAPDHRLNPPARYCVGPSTTDELNCGACGVDCADTGIQGRPTCCQGACVDRSTNCMNCGTCGNACVSGEKCCDGRRLDVTGDNSNCGDCGSDCKPPQVCQNSSCVCPANCPPGQVQDPQTCACTCGSCPPGQVPDSQTCACTCGSCPPGQVQDPQTCACTCPGGTKDCGGKCVDTQNDRGNCGGCGHPCQSSQSCVAGVCNFVCCVNFADPPGACCPSYPAPGTPGGAWCLGGGVCCHWTYLDVQRECTEAMAPSSSP
jgi:hypothetical protein